MTDQGSTHWDGCWEGGRRHYDCALAEIARLREQLDAVPVDAIRSIALSMITPISVENIAVWRAAWRDIDAWLAGDEEKRYMGSIDNHLYWALHAPIQQTHDNDCALAQELIDLLPESLRSEYQQKLDKTKADWATKAQP